MASAVQVYTDEIHESLEYWATWLPNETIRLGDYGPVRDRVFHSEGSLSKLGIAFKVAPKGQPVDIQHISKGGVRYSIHGSTSATAGPTLPLGQAGFELAFTRANATVFVARGARTSRVEDIDQLNRMLLDLVREGEFRGDHAVVTNVVEVDSATVFVASQAGARIALSAGADIAAGLLDLANAALGLTVVSAEGLETEVVAAKKITPLFNLAGFKKGGIFRGSPSFGRLGFEEDPDPGELAEVVPADTDADH